MVVKINKPLSLTPNSYFFQDWKQVEAALDDKEISVESYWLGLLVLVHWAPGLVISVLLQISYHYRSHTNLTLLLTGCFVY